MAISTTSLLSLPPFLCLLPSFSLSLPSRSVSLSLTKQSLVSETTEDKNRVVFTFFVQHTPKHLTQSRHSIHVVELNQIALLYKGLQAFPIQKYFIMPVGIPLIATPKPDLAGTRITYRTFKNIASRAPFHIY